MKPINWHYPRAELAQQYLTTIGRGPVSRLALLGVRRIGKTAFLLHDVCEQAIALKFLPVYINLWDNPDAPQDVIIHTLQRYLASLDEKGLESVRELLASEVTKLEVNFGIIQLSADMQPSPSVPASALTLIGNLFRRLVNKARSHGLRPLIVIDEVQHLNTSASFWGLQGTLRTQFDSFPETCVIFAGSSRGGIHAMFNHEEALCGTTTKPMPFFRSAMLVDFPLLDEDFVHHFYALLIAEFALDYPQAELSYVFRQVEKSPFWFRMVMAELITQRLHPFAALEIVQERMKLDGDFEGIARQLRPLDVQVYLRLCRNLPVYTQSFFAQAVQLTGRKQVTKSAVQKSVTKLLNKRLLTKAGGSYFNEIPGLQSFLGEAVQV
ncbi:ATP-binding protein [Vibrio quintilis]|uniref:Archaeal ATPase n=1 Tax=Vibrio quintilis TaxID=1117707 RepID=A0A1M7YXQ5_9VIBR|nr:ATP-binding protein [Vibrio quintilis]SHO57467.1 Archaeal ATPase [Vibrio quintilis]